MENIEKKNTFLYLKDNGNYPLISVTRLQDNQIISQIKCKINLEPKHEV